MTDRWLYPWGVGSLAFGGASLLVPLYLVELSASAFELGVLAASAAFVAAPGGIAFGRLADRTERRRTILLGTLATTAVVLAVIPLLERVWTVVVANAVLWSFVSSVGPVLTMLVVDDVPESRWAERIGLLNKFQGFGWAGGLVLGVLWPTVGRYVVSPDAVTPVLFWVLSGCAAASVVGAARTLPRPDPSAHVESDQQARRIARLLTASRRGVRGATAFWLAPNRLYWSARTFRPGRFRQRVGGGLATYLVAAACFFAGFAAFWAPLPLYLSAAGFDVDGVFALYLASSLASAFLYEGAGTLASRYDVRVLQSSALAVRGILFPAVLVVAGVGATTLGFVVAGGVLAAIGVTWAVIAVVGTALVTQLSPPALRGDALGVYTALGAVAGGVGGVLGGWAATDGYLTAFVVAGALVAFGAILVLAIGVFSGASAASDLGSSPGDSS